MTIAVAVASFGFSITTVAAAEEPGPATAPPALSPSAPAADQPAGASTQPEGGGERWHAAVDAVLGFGATPVLSQRIVGPLVTDESHTAERARFQTTSVNLGLSYDASSRLRLGALLPLGAGSLIPNETRGSTVVGNVTLGGAYEAHARKDLVLSLGLGVALPTASGTELPDPKTVDSLGHVDQTALDRRSLLQAMSDSRGREDTAAFATDHLGIVPKIAALYTGMEKVELEGYVKYESLHAIKSIADYEGAVVVAARGSYRLGRHADATLRAWTNIGVAGPDGVSVLVEPEARFHVGALMPVVGVVLPVAGDLTAPYDVGVRASLAANF